MRTAIRTTNAQSHMMPVRANRVEPKAGKCWDYCELRTLAAEWQGSRSRTGADADNARLMALDAILRTAAGEFAISNSKCRGAFIALAMGMHMAGALTLAEARAALAVTARRYTGEAEFDKGYAAVCALAA